MNLLKSFYCNFLYVCDWGKVKGKKGKGLIATFTLSILFS
ncbi:hypothetical protein FDUTEX481_08805 [Tolypothrix sp. PCC 7601]|nr:hypothetical protein FDUTEX481_08805 [Tolypothrix sp. PCC 7601]